MPGLFTIPLGSLKAGHHRFEYRIEKTFFEQFEESEIEEGDLIIIIEADKQSTHADLVVNISGTVSMPCDRCLGVFSQPLSCSNRLLVKFGREPEVEDPDMIIVPADGYDLDMTQYFYEYILLALPAKRIHPENSNGQSLCDPEMLSKLNEHLVNDDNETDPRWDELKKLMNDN